MINYDLKYVYRACPKCNTYHKMKNYNVNEMTGYKSYGKNLKHIK